MAAIIETHNPENVIIFKNRSAKYRAKNKEKRNAEAARWWAENGAAYREANREKINETYRL